MAGFLISFFTVVLVLASLFLVLIVLMQRGSEGGSGAAFGGGMAESAFGGQTNQVLTRATVVTSIVFFVVGLGLYLGQIAAHKKAEKKIALEQVIAKAQEKADVQAQAMKPAEMPKLGEATAEAEKVLAAETQSGAQAAVVQKSLVETTGEKAAEPKENIPGPDAREK